MNLSPDQLEQFSPRPWIHLNTTYDVEAWMDSYNRDLQQAVNGRNLTGYGICFHLEEGGDIFLHTTPDGDVVLDVTTEAEWVTPVIAAATRTEAASSRIWALPGHTLTQLVFGLSSLISTSRIVLHHPFRVKKW
jgi:hypothetical protein